MAQGGSPVRPTANPVATLVMSDIVLGLDIGGANLKAATPEKRARSVPFPLWKQPDALPAALAALVAEFPDATELAVTMTGELCDCFETKREGVSAIIKAVRFASAARRVRVWSTDGAFLDSEQAKANHLKVAAANWHALATFAARSLTGPGILIDVGSTTTDVIPLLHGKAFSQGHTDRERLRSCELIYAGVRRTPVCALLGSSVAAELFATTHDAHLLLGKVSEAPTDTDTADGRPATRAFAHARLARMVGGDAETVTLDEAVSLADEVRHAHTRRIEYSISAAISHLKMVTHGGQPKAPIRYTISGSGEFLVRDLFKSDFHVPPALNSYLHQRIDLNNVDSLTDQLGPEVSACAPAHAVAVLAAEARA
jgi:(4-(4-[2-(gamma-L-glutamylamino)ethyl]phenoxymethyl)furan-2-yl)methanamine synthase